jgi:phosphoserine phosphatase RsbU/P
LAAIGKKIKKAFLVSVSGALFLSAFIFDIINWSVKLDEGWINVVRDFSVIFAFVIVYFLIESIWRRDQTIVKKLGFILITTIVVVLASFLLSYGTNANFDLKNYTLFPLGFDSIVLANIFGVVIGITIVIVLLQLRDIILAKRRKGKYRNFIILISFIFATSLSSLVYRPLETGIITYILFSLTIIMMVVNSFRLSWIVYLSKREKIFSITYGFFLLCVFIGFDVMTMSGSSIGKALVYYSPPLKWFVTSTALFGTIYFGMTFVSTLFHLPTAEAFDRKRSEVTSLHNLSRLVTQVLDFNELVETVTKMTLEVCEAQSSWLEIISQPSQTHSSKIAQSTYHEEVQYKTVSLKNISFDEAQAIILSNKMALRSQVVETKKPFVIDVVNSDRRTKNLPEIKNKFKSIVIAPLLSHDQVIGVLYATKSMEYGFDKEDVDLISAFADQATIAIENSRLIEKSMERERLMREMMLAQEMQKKLLPQKLPSIPEIDLEAISTPAFEVGGDYYDYTMLDDNHLGVVVGDVSGKGVSAAFYMAEMKGIFQSLSKIYHSPSEFLSRAHASLIDTIDRKSFISLIYAVVDLSSGKMSVARAGHCPLLYMTKGNATYVKPQGLGLGMGSSEFFREKIVQEDIQLAYGDTVVFYTDGVTEAHNKNGMAEFGYDRLLQVVESAENASAVGVRDAIIMAVDKHMNHQPPADDLTIVVMKWMKK